MGAKNTRRIEEVQNNPCLAYGVLSTDTTKATPLIINPDTGGVLLDDLPSGSNNIGEVDVPSVDKFHHPFAKGALTTDGVQYSAEVAGIDHTAFGAVESIEIQQPTGYTLEEIEFGLTAAVASSGATKDVYWKWQASDDGVSWEDLIAAQTRAADASAYADVSCAGRFAPTGNFLGTSASFHVRLVIEAEDGVETVKGKTKNSSYVICRYRRT